MEGGGTPTRALGALVSESAKKEFIPNEQIANTKSNIDSRTQPPTVTAHSLNSSGSTVKVTLRLTLLLFFSGQSLLLGQFDGNVAYQSEREAHQVVPYYPVLWLTVFVSIDFESYCIVQGNDVCLLPWG